MMQTGTVILDEPAMRQLLSKHFKAYIDGFKSVEKIKKKERKPEGSADGTEKVLVYEVSFRFKETA